MKNLERIKKIMDLENKYFKSPITKLWSLEALGEEDEINESSDYSEPPIDSSYLEDTNDVEEGTGDGYGNDDMIPDVNEEDESGFNPGEMGDVSVDLEGGNESDVVNFMEMSGSLMNTYLKNMDGVSKTNKNLIDYSGNIKEHSMYEKFISPAIKTILLYSKETQLEKKINNFMTVIEDKKKMLSICGTKQSPFIYESLQLLLIESLRQLLAVMPLAIKNTISIEDAIEKFGYTHISKLVEAMVDVAEISSLFGEKIYFMEPDEAKELSDSNEAINNTPYVQNVAFEKMSEMNRFLTTYSATESILNLIEIRNNKSLMEFSLVMKLCIFISSLVKDVNLNASCNSVLETIKKLLTMDITNGEAVENSIDDIIAQMRSEVIMPQLNKTADIEVETEKDMTQIKSDEEE